MVRRSPQPSPVEKGDTPRERGMGEKKKRNYRHRERKGNQRREETFIYRQFPASRRPLRWAMSFRGVTNRGQRQSEERKEGL